MDTVSPVTTDETLDTAPDLPAEHVTIDQVVAGNMRHWRRTAGMTQEELGARLGWSARNVSAAERSADEKRDRRRFDAQTLADLSLALGVPLIAFFLPPGDDGKDRRYLFPSPLDGELDMTVLMDRVVMPDTDADNPALPAYRAQLSDQVARYLDLSWRPVVARWLAERTDDSARADFADRLRLRGETLRALYEDLHEIAAAIAPETDGDPDGG